MTNVRTQVHCHYRPSWDKVLLPRSQSPAQRTVLYSDPVFHFSACHSVSIQRVTREGVDWSVRNRVGGPTCTWCMRRTCCYYISEPCILYSVSRFPASTRASFIDEVVTTTRHSLESSFLECRYGFRIARSGFEFEGHRVNVKVTTAINVVGSKFRIPAV